MSDAVLVALITTLGLIVVALVPSIAFIVKRQVQKGAKQVSALNTEEHLANAAKLDSIVAAVSTQGETLGRVETTVMRQAEVLADHLSWHLHAPLVSKPPVKDHAA